MQRKCQQCFSQLSALLYFHRAAAFLPARRTAGWPTYFWDSAPRELLNRRKLIAERLRSDEKTQEE